MVSPADDWELSLPPTDVEMEEGALATRKRESSHEKRHRSSESVSSSSDMLRMIVQTELQTVVSETVIPEMMQQIETRMSGLQSQNLELVNTANTVLKQVQQSFQQIRTTQQILNDQVSREQLKTMSQGQKLEQVVTHQEAQQHALHQTVEEARTGFSIIDRAISNHEERLTSQNNFGQDDRGLGHTPNARVVNWQTGTMPTDMNGVNNIPVEVQSQVYAPPTVVPNFESFQSCPIGPDLLNESSMQPQTNMPWNGMCNVGASNSPPVSPDPMTGACMQPANNVLSTWPRGVKVSPPPVLGPSRYVVWKKEFLFWRDLYAFLPDGYLLSVMGSGSVSSLRLMIMKMFHETKMNPNLRSIPLLLNYLDSSYAVTSREREMNALERLLELRREGSETVQGFWLRFEAIVTALENTSSVLSSELVFMRALKSLQLSHQQKNVCSYDVGLSK